jgi:hypothetical protein
MYNVWGRAMNGPVEFGVSPAVLAGWGDETVAGGVAAAA